MAFVKFENIHWTSHVHSIIALSYPLTYFLYNNLHEYTLYRKCFLKQSDFEIPSKLLQMLDDEFSTVSDRRLRPLKNCKFSIALIDSVESKTIGSFAFVPGCLFQIATRTALSDVKEIRKHFSNLSSLIGKSDLNNVSVDLISDEELSKIILSEMAKKYALIHEIIKADNSSVIIVPIFNFLVCCLATFPLIPKILPYIGSILTILLAATISISIFLIGDKFWKKFRILSFDKKICEIGEFYAKGCREYLQKSQELGKILYKLGGAEKQNVYASNGDYLLDPMPYSTRLKLVENHLQKALPKKDAKKNLKKIITLKNN